MDEGRRDDALSAADEALRTLRAELSVEPSPDFRARVRMRVAERPIRTPRWTWLVPAAAAAALVLAGLVVARRGPRTGPALIKVVESPAPARQATEPKPSEPVSSEPRSIERPPSTVRAARPAIARRDAKEVVEPLVPPGEGARIARYVASVSRRPFAPETLPVADPEEPLADPAPIEIVPLDVAPLVPDEGSPR
jgi:hypothetical protein